MKKGFTLIELMIVVAIIGVLAAVAIPKFANLIKKAQEAACKGQLGAIRSALSIYYGDKEGTWPVELTHMTPTYIQTIPNAKPGNGDDSNTVVTITDGSISAVTDAAGWWYNNATNTSGANDGVVKVNSTDTDTKDTALHLW
ncbi:MAG: type II secretion system protein [Elusimicrobia bacterium]|nr:type II secretion system protein [Elusimicrobiota bacterium]